MRATISTLVQDTRGMTLIDISIMLLVAGILAVPMAQQYDQWRIAERQNQSEGSTQIIDNAIEEFYFLTNRYPCPAKPGLAQNHAEYGLENCVDDQDASSTDGALIGEIPFKTLNIPDTDQKDGWSNRITYAVTEAYANINNGFTDPVTGLPSVDFSSAPGIQLTRIIMTPDPVTLVPVCDFATPPEVINTHYTLLSHGENGAGAISSEGNTGTLCTAISEIENCDGDKDFLHQQCRKNSRADYFDDYTNYRDETPTKLWPPTETNQNETVTNISRVGIGEGEPIVSLDVIGNVKIEGAAAPRNGNLITDFLCTNDMDSSNNPTTCFYPDLLVGDEPSMDCGNQGITKIANNSAECGGGSVQPAGQCAINEFLTGYDQNGDVICILKP